MTLLITVNKKHICNFPFINIISKVVISKVFINIAIVSHIINWGAWHLMAENLQAVWAEFSTLSWSVLLQCNITAWLAHSHF
jgi:hypothetical protein